LSTSSELKKEYSLRFSGLEEYRDGVWKVLCKGFFSKYISSTDTLVDVGAGYGEFSRNISAAKKYAIDLNPDTEALVGPAVNFLNQDCSKAWPIDDESVDVVFTSNFFEHLPTKGLIEDTVLQAYRKLKPGGKIICLGPNIRFVPGDYWDYWDHHVAISDNSIAELLELKGFSIDEKVDRFLPYTMSGGSTPPLFFVSLYIRFPFLWRIFGKQFFVVATK
jgi:SAM-dependent methyltransferase